MPGTIVRSPDRHRPATPRARCTRRRRIRPRRAVASRSVERARVGLGGEHRDRERDRRRRTDVRRARVRARDERAQHRLATGRVRVRGSSTPWRTCARAARSTVFGMSWSLRSQNTRNPSSCMRSNAVGPGFRVQLVADLDDAEPRRRPAAIASASARPPTSRPSTMRSRTAAGTSVVIIISSLPPRLQ